MSLNCAMKSMTILTGICIKRFPYITKPLNDLEMKMDELNKKLEFEKSVMSDFELRKLKEDQMQKKFMDSPSNKDDYKLDTEIITTRENIETWTKNYQQLNYDTPSKLYSNKLQLLIVNQKLSKEDDYQWFLPVFKFENDFKSLKEQAESYITSPDIKVSKVPSYCYKYRHKKNQIKIFFLNAYMQRNALIHENIIKLNENISNTAWVTLDELNNYIKNPKFLKIIHSFVKEF